MSKPTKTIRLTEDFQAFAEELVRSGKNATIEEVARDAFQEKKLRELRDALNVGIAQLDAGLGRECSPKEFMDEVCAELGISR